MLLKRILEVLFICVAHRVSFVQQMKDVVDLFFADLNGLGRSGGRRAIGSLHQSLDLNLRVELDRPATKISFISRQKKWKRQPISTCTCVESHWLKRPLLAL